MNLDKNLKKEILTQQQNEITEHIIYKKLAKICKNKNNKKILENISNDELKHHDFWKNITKETTKPKKITIFFYLLLAKIFGLTFSLKLMEKNESSAQKFYKRIALIYPQVKKIEHDEEEHEKKLITMLKDEKLKYAGAIVLGLNDALVELTGTLAGLSFAFQNSKIIGFTGLIMGIAASLSMAASGYLSSREEENNELNPIKSAIYTGFAYIITVAILITPYFIFQNIKIALTSMLILTIIIIASYTYYISIAKEIKFKPRFLEMVFISLGVALISFTLGYFIKTFFGIEI